MVYFEKIFLNGTIGMALLTWRFFTFYIFLIVGVGTVLLEKIILKREKKRRLLHQTIPQTSAKNSIFPEDEEIQE